MTALGTTTLRTSSGRLPRERTSPLHERCLGPPLSEPFASPPGEGLSSSTVNVLWGLFNLAVGYLLVCRVGNFELRKTSHVVVLGLGVLAMAIMLSRRSGSSTGDSDQRRRRVRYSWHRVRLIRNVASDTFMHLTSCEGAAEVIEETLRRLGRSETVVSMRDIFNEGPLHDIDAGGASRIAWWTRIHGDAVVKEVEPEIFDDSDLWDAVRAQTADVVIWHGLHPMERVFELRACWQLREQPERVHESHSFRAGGPGSQGHGSPSATVFRSSARRDRRRGRTAFRSPTSRRDARRWQELRDVPGTGFVS